MHNVFFFHRDIIQQNDTAKWGLIVLLISKAAGIKPGIPEKEQDGLTGMSYVCVVFSNVSQIHTS